MLGLIAEHNLAVAAKQNLEVISVPNDDHLLQAIEKVKTIRQNILRAIRNIKIANQSKLANFESNASLLETKMQSLPAKERQEIKLQRDRIVKVEMYKELLKKKEEAAPAATPEDIQLLREIRDALKK